MHDEDASEKNPAAGVTTRVPWRVVAVRARPDFQLDVEFADGTRGRFDYSELVHADDAGVFAALRDVNVFNRVFIDHGAVTWPGEIDVAPDAMYDRLKSSPGNAVVIG
jgi:hypothetical protein